MKLHDSQREARSGQRQPIETVERPLMILATKVHRLPVADIRADDLRDRSLAASAVGRCGPAPTTLLWYVTTAACAGGFTAGAHPQRTPTPRSLGGRVVQTKAALSARRVGGGVADPTRLPQTVGPLLGRVSTLFATQGGHDLQKVLEVLRALWVLLGAASADGRTGLAEVGGLPRARLAQRDLAAAQRALAVVRHWFETNQWEVAARLRRPFGGRGPPRAR
jgi:hypothetical protein